MSDNKTGDAQEDSNTEQFKSLGVCKELCDICKDIKWTIPTPIQKEAIPHALNGRDIIGLAETGSGKTGAFAIPILQALLDKPQRIFALVISPTRELAIQIGETFTAFGTAINASICVILGGMDMIQQAVSLAKRPHIIIATPGRIVDHLQKTKGFSLKTIKYLVLDEADRLMTSDFEKEINILLSVLPKDKHTYMFSATMTDKVSKLQKASIRNPVKLEVSQRYTTVKSLVQRYIFIPEIYKDVYLVYLCQMLSNSSILVFVATCDATTKIALILRNLGMHALPLHGRMSQPKRLGALQKFKSKEDEHSNILIATDVASRGLDIPSVDYVFNYDIPAFAKDYIHRVGRTARAGRTGQALSFITQYTVDLFQRIEKLIDIKMEEYKLVESEVLVFQERVNEAQRMATREFKEIRYEIDGKRKSKSEHYRKKKRK